MAHIQPALKKFKHSARLKRLQIDPSAFVRVSKVLACAALRCALIFENAISMGLRSGL
jgi:hypothetical protein